METQQQERSLQTTLATVLAATAACSDKEGPPITVDTWSCHTQMWEVPTIWPAVATGKTVNDTWMPLLCSRRNSGSTTIRMEWPTVSAALCPKIRPAARFLEIIVPVRSRVMLAPSNEAAVASRSAASSKDAEDICNATCYARCAA
jgi:hypothetical protein